MGYRVQGGGPTQTFRTARDCAVFHFGTEAVVPLPFDVWMDMATGATVLIEAAT